MSVHKSLLSLALFLSFCILPATYSQAATKGILVDVPTQSQIQQFVKDHPILYGTNNKVTYAQVPSINSPYIAGKIASNYQNDGLNAANIVRYIVGVPSNLTLKDEYIEAAQATSVVIAANNALSHYPQRPPGMSDELYEAGKAGAGKSNLANGFSLLSSAIIAGYMDDGDYTNISKLGHRRWIMNPVMGATGFGFAPNQYSAMYAFDESNEVDEKYSVTVWPAQNMPVEYFGAVYPFNVSLSQDFDELDRNSLQVRMTRQSDNKTFLFDSQTSNDPNSITFFDVNNELMGQPRCIIWRPDVASYKSGDIYSIELLGVKKDGEAYPISYDVSFFSLAGNSGQSVTPTATIPQLSNLRFSLPKVNPVANTLKISFTSDKAGYVYSYVYDSKNTKVATIANGSSLKNAGGWTISWSGKGTNGNPLSPGTYRINTYLGNGKQYGKAQSKNIEILPIDFPQLPSYKLSADSFDPQSTVLSINFSTNRSCTVYCNVYDENNSKVFRISGGGAVSKAGNWTLKWKGVDSNGNQVAPGSYRIELALSNGKVIGNTFNRTVEVQ